MEVNAGGDLLISRRGRAVQVVLNSEAALNALSLDMAAALLDLLGQWAEDPEVACVVFQGAGARAFCAGGDIRSLYASMRRGDRLEWLLALTGGEIGADDAVFLGLADCSLAGGEHPDLLEFAAAGPDAASLSDWLSRRHSPVGNGWMQGVRDPLAAAAGLGSCTEVLERLAELAGSHPDIERFCGCTGCPATASLPRECAP